MKPCKLKVGDQVRHRKDLYGSTLSTVTGIEKRFENERGGTMSEGDIKSICLPYTYDGETVVVQYPEKDYGRWIQKAFVDSYKWIGYSVTVSNEKLTSIWPHERLRKVN